MDALEYDLEMEDLHAYNLHHFRSSRVTRSSRLALHLTLTFLLAALLASLAVLSGAPLPFWLAGGAILATWFVLFPRRLEQMLRRQTERMYRQGKNAGLLGRHRLQLTDEALVESSSLREVRTKWAAIEQVVRAPAHLFVYVTAFSAVIVPIRALGDREAADRLAGEIERRRDGAPP